MYIFSMKILTINSILFLFNIFQIFGSASPLFFLFFFSALLFFYFFSLFLFDF
ncbi:hypothetical protein HanXRQr2_Chr01g0041941 [Helianthus annuus]|uniref:Uncharacterized protein n=1 Tax=Helianthus annuus TaxID=4232 RepID=A0A9K3JZH2_HELAN|nr:hypothetical protein HanXRQr2_Chr01g0041941 [Helianthus annuus]